MLLLSVCGGLLPVGCSSSNDPKPPATQHEGTPRPARYEETLQIGPVESLLGEYLPYESVRKDLRLDAAQQERIEALKADYSREEKAASNGGLPFEEVPRALAQVRTRYHRQLCEILDPGQQKRFREIHLQAIGVHAWAETQVRRDLGLSKVQEARIEKLLEAAYEKERAAQKKWIASGDDPRSRETAISVAAEECKRIERLLTDEQRQTWKEMLGQAFSFKDMY
jgi:hypothetical protein